MADTVYGVHKFRSMGEFWAHLPAGEREIVDVLRQIVLENLPSWCRERLAYNVPCYYGNKRICLIWPASIPRGGVTTGVLLGFSQGHRLANADKYLTQGTNKVVFYTIYRSVEEIDERAIVLLLSEAVKLDSPV